MKTMNRIFRYAFWKLKGTKVYALVGKSGTGKSFRSKLVAQKYGIDLIIDDGLLIRGDRILAGKSAKRESNVLSAVRTAVFDDIEQQEQVIEAIQKEKFHKILIIGTSEKMVYKIASRLNLPQPEKMYRIEDIATKEEIETAMRIRYTEGKHVIPVPSIEITRNYPQIVYDTMRVFFKNDHRSPFNKKNVSFEKTIVRPEFSKYGKVAVSEAALTQMGLASFCALKGLSTRNDDPEHASRPFDKGRDGFLLAEGAGVVVIEELEHALNRGATIYSELAGYGASGDGHHITAPDPEGKGAVLAMKRCLADANVNTEDVQYINTYGTSTVLGDIAETRAMKKVFGDWAKSGLMVSSTKSAHGHLLGASGGVELIACTKAIQKNVIPPTLNLEDPDPECDLDYVPNTPREAKIDVALSNSFGFGGHNACLVIRRFVG